MSERLQTAMQELDDRIEAMVAEERLRERLGREAYGALRRRRAWRRATERVRFIPSHRAHEHIDMASLP